MKSRIYIGLGANLKGPNGESPLEACGKALGLLSKSGISLKAISPVYESAPWPPSDQPWYVNAVAWGETDLAPDQVMARFLVVEESLGRIRTEKNAARCIDLDIIDFAGQVLPSKEKWRAAQQEKSPKGLFLPHLRAHERTFVLKPLLDIDPGWYHPVLGIAGNDLLSGLSPEGLRISKATLNLP